MIKKKHQQNGEVFLSKVKVATKIRSLGFPFNLKLRTFCIYRSSGTPRSVGISWPGPTPGSCQRSATSLSTAKLEVETDDFLGWTKWMENALVNGQFYDGNFGMIF